MIVLALTTTIATAMLLYAASVHQRWLSVPLPRLAARGSAVLSALVAVNAWINSFTTAAGLTAWLVTTMFVAVSTTYLSAWTIKKS
jgi:hypothetical protein